MIKVGVSGGLGEMGKKVCKHVNNDNNMELAVILEHPGHELSGQEYNSIKVTDSAEEALELSDVIIDFSTVESALNIVSASENKNCRLVICTTGFNDKQKEIIEKAASNTPLVLSPNMSLGVNLMFKISEKINEVLKEYEREIIEAHHNRKKDAPSGTAAELLRTIKNDGDEVIYGREGIVGPRKKNEIGVHAVRGGNIIGDHTVLWIGEADQVELRHKAQSRDIFAEGSVRAAHWLMGNNPGRIYTMQDVLS